MINFLLDADETILDFIRSSKESLAYAMRELHIPYSESPEYVFFDNTDEMRVKLPWSAYGVFERGLTSMLTDKFEFEDLDIGFDAAEYYSESRMQKLIFAELTAEESEAVAEIKLFDHNIYEGEYEGANVNFQFIKDGNWYGAKDDNTPSELLNNSGKNTWFYNYSDGNWPDNVHVKITVDFNTMTWSYEDITE